MTTEFELRPFRWDNLLAFMALLGLMRALEAARPDWRVRTFWRRRGGRGPWVPVLVTRGCIPRDSLLSAILEGLRELGNPLEEMARQLDEKTTAFDLFGQLTATTDQDRERLEALCGLVGIHVTRDKSGEIRIASQVTPFLPKAKSGQQNFLNRIAGLTSGLYDPLVRPRRKRKQKSPFRQFLHECLFDAWHPRPATEGFRWDPSEHRSYAYRFSDPSKDEAEVVVPAARLAVLALPWFPSIPCRSGRRCPCFVETAQRRIRLRWPIWYCAARPSAVRALLAHPAFARPEFPSRSELAPFGVAEVMAARVVWTGNRPNDYPNFTRGEPLWGAAPS